ncbi:MAG: S41 family peptidase [Chloroflexi bacterium]|nr:S41 family peptidase [Chloroflexota bacterium]
MLSSEYVDRGGVDPSRLAEGAIRGMLQTLGDPYSQYLPPDHYRMELQDFQGSFSGIGSELYQRDGRLILVPLPNSPAERAGVRPGDVVLTVDGADAAGWTALDAVGRIRGPKGTSVSLRVQHLGVAEPTEITVVRDTVQLESVSYYITDDSFAYIRLAAFYDNSDEALRKALQEVQNQSVRGIVLDLRDNPGGFLATAVSVASEFLSNGLVVYEVDGGGHRTDWPVRAGGVALDVPMVVLVNGRSASASEVLAGALRDHGRAKLVGTTTLGKGTVNLLKGLSNGGGLYYSYARWHTPNGTVLEGQGLSPDVEVPQPGGGIGDVPLERALEVLRQQTNAPAALLPQDSHRSALIK